MKKTDTSNLGNVIIFHPKGEKATLEIHLKEETVWLSQKQMALLFDKDVRTINEHIINIFKEKELTKTSVIRKFRITANDGKLYDTVFYNLDMIISVGYRVNSKRGTQFRIWATNVLKQHLIEGYTINEKRLKEQAENVKTLQRTVQMLADLSHRKALTSDEAKGLFEVIRDYSYGLDVLDDYDHGRIEIKSATAKESYQLTYDEGIRLIQQMRQKFGGSSLFGHEKDQSFKSALGAIYQTFSSKDLYPSVEEKAANLLYLVVKNHSFSDGNKRIAAALFVWFLDRNKILYKADNSKRIADNALVAITLMIAESQPKEKDIIVALVVNLINKLN
jgi:prophage maintenance system killer protein